MNTDKTDNDIFIKVVYACDSKFYYKNKGGDIEEGFYFTMIDFSLRDLI